MASSFYNLCLPQFTVAPNGWQLYTRPMLLQRLYATFSYHEVNLEREWWQLQILHCHVAATCCLFVHYNTDDRLCWEGHYRVMQCCSHYSLQHRLNMMWCFSLKSVQLKFVRIDLMHWRHISITTMPCWGSRLVKCYAHMLCWQSALALSLSVSARARASLAVWTMQGIGPLAACLAMAHVAVPRLTPNARGRPSVTLYSIRSISNVEFSMDSLQYDEVIHTVTPNFCLTSMSVTSSISSCVDMVVPNMLW